MAKLKRILPKCGKEIKKALIDKDMDINDLARAVGLSREYVSALITGRMDVPEGRKQLCDYLNIPFE